MESTKTFVENPSGKLAVTVHAPRSLREEEAAYFHGINLEQAHKFAHLNGWQLTVDQEKDDTVSAADTDSFKIGDTRRYHNRWSRRKRAKSDAHRGKSGRVGWGRKNRCAKAN